MSAQGEQITVGTLGIDVEANVAEFEKQARTQLKASAERVGRETGATLGNAAGKAAGDAQVRHASDPTRKQQLKNLAAQQAREQAKAAADALLQQYRLDMARVKEGQARGFLTKQQAAQAGREAAQSYNLGMLAVLDAGSRNGAFSGGAGRGLFAQLAGSIKAVGVEGKRSGLGLGEMRESLASVAAQAAGVHPIFGRISNVLGSFALGSGWMVAVLAGMAALGWAWNKLTEDTKANREATIDALAEIDKIERDRLTRGTADFQDRARIARESQAAAAERLREAVDAYNAADARGFAGGGQNADPERARAAALEEVTRALNAEEAATRRLIAADRQLQDAHGENRAKDEREAEAALRKIEQANRKSLQLMEDWHDSRLTMSQRRIEELREIEAAFIKHRDNQTAALVRAQREEIEGELALLQFAANTMYMLIERMERQQQKRNGGSKTEPETAGGGPLPNRTARISDAQRQRIRNAATESRVMRAQDEFRTAIAELELLRAQEKLTEQQFSRGAAEAAQVFRDTLLAELKVAGELTPELSELFAQLFKTIEDGDEKGVKNLVDNITRLASGLLSVIDALGILSDDQREAFQSAVHFAQGLLQVVESAKQLKAALDAVAVSKTAVSGGVAGIISGSIMAIGALVSLGKMMFGESAEEKERRDILRDNNRQLERLALELRGFTVSIDVLRRFVNNGAAGFAGAELDAIAQEFGISIRDRNGRLVQAALNQLKAAAQRDIAAGGVVVGGIQPQDRLNVSMTVVQGNRLVDLMASSVDHLGAIRAAITGGYRATLPSPTAPGAPVVAGGMVFNIQLSVPVTGAVTPANAHAVGAELGRGFADRLHDRYAAAGVKGPLTIQVRS